MTALFAKELIVILKNNKFSLIAIPVFIAIGLIYKQMMFMMIVPALFSMLPLGTMTYDEISHWDLYVQALPVNKKKIVTSKYLAVITLALLSAVLIGTIMFIIKFFDSATTNNTIVFMILSALFIGMVIPCISIPINFKFGTSRGRFVYLMIVGLICGIFPNIILSDASKITAKLVELVRTPLILTFISLGILIMMIFISWLVSVSVYEKKEA